MLLNHKWRFLTLAQLLFLIHISMANATVLNIDIRGGINDTVFIQATVVDEDVKTSCTRDFTIYYKLNESVFIPSFSDNTETLNRLRDFINACQRDSSLTIKRIVVTGSCSVEGGMQYNKTLSINRYTQCLNYLQKNNIDLSRYPIDVIGAGANWTQFRTLTENSGSPYKSQIMEVLNSNLTDNAKLTDMKRMDNGKLYSFLRQDVFPKLRYTNIAINYDSLSKQSQPVNYIFPRIMLYEPVEVPVYQEVVEVIEPAWRWKPLLALKTNLLFDALTALNVEVEVPIKQNWSIAGEWMFPWWLRDKDNPNKKPWRLELLCGTLEGRYWFGNRQERRVLTGWFAGLYTGAGLYDIQWKAKGYQGEFFVAAGVSAGYAHQISKRFPNLSMEYSLGIGFFRSHYRHYEAFFGSDTKWHPIRLNNGRYTWIGPTRLKVSLVWLLNYKSKKGGNL